MATIAREAGISKALLYHYFPSKSEYFRATVSAEAERLAALTEPDPDLPPLEALTASLDAYLGWIEENADSFSKLMESATGSSEVRDLVDEVRNATATRILEASRPAGPLPRCGPRWPAGSGSWTARAWTGWPTATWTARRCATCCWAPLAGR